MSRTPGHPIDPEGARLLADAVKAKRRAIWRRATFIGVLLAVPMLINWRSPASGDEFWPFTLGWAACYGLVGMSVNVLTGYAGQISLSQAALMGTGAFALGNFYALQGVPFWISVPMAGLLTAAVALVVGFPALRIRGLNLAIVTITFQFLMARVVFRQQFVSRGSAGIDVPSPSFFGIELSFAYRFLYVVIAAGAILWWLDHNLVRTKAGRAFFAIREDERVAASFGIPVDRYKLLAFAISGFYAGVAGALFGTMQHHVTNELFDYTHSIEFLVFAVIGGLGSRGGVVVGSMFPIVFRQVVTGLQFWGVVLGGVLLILTLTRYPGGLAEQGRELAHIGGHLWKHRRHVAHALLLALREMARSPVRAWGFRAEYARGVRELVSDGVALMKTPGRIPSTVAALWHSISSGHGAKAAAGHGVPVPDTRPLEVSDLLFTGTNGHRPPISLRRDLGRRRAGAVLEARDVSIRFGGVQALDGVSIEVREGEIVGLMGPNGAGKTTLFNCVTGFAQPDEGLVVARGRDIGDLAPHARAALGFGRTFQNIGLVKSQSVLDNLLIAQHMVTAYGPLEGMLHTTATQASEAHLRARAREVLSRLKLEEYAHAVVKDLPHGLLKRVEMGAALVTGPELLLLDEPSSGMGPQEAEELGTTLREIQEAFDVTILMIEHHVPLVLAVADYVYVLNFGKMLAEGDAQGVAANPDVIEAYLGEGVGAH